jgi:hypothetical protein
LVDSLRRQGSDQWIHRVGLWTCSQPVGQKFKSTSSRKKAFHSPYSFALLVPN